MKHYLCICLMFLVTHLFGQQEPTETECSANAGGNDTICYYGNMCLSTDPDLSYAVPPGIQWTYVSGPLPDSEIAFTNPNDLNTCVLNLSNSPTWPVGDYIFEFCVNCADIDGDNVIDRPCDLAVITVMPEIIEPVITEGDGNEDGEIFACDIATFNINSGSLLPGSQFSVVPTINDGFLTITTNGGVVTVLANDLYSACQYDLVYSVTNGGCEKSDTVTVHFINPQDPNYDGIIEGTIDKCPSCSNKVDLLGDRPGCGGIGTWTVIGTPVGATVILDPANTSLGDATATVSHIGHYVFVYTVTNIAPCPNSTDTVECDILQIGNFELGPNQFTSICNNILPAGIYPVCFNQLSNAIYQWTTTHPGVTLSPDNQACTNIIVPIDITLPLVLHLSAFKFYVDPDCGGPLLPTELQLPYTGVNETVEDVIAALNAAGICFYICRDDAYVYYYGEPVVNVKTQDVNLLCSSGKEDIQLSKYFTVTNGVGYSGFATLVSQNPQCLTTPFQVGVNQVFALDVSNCGGCGEFVFQVTLRSYNPVNGTPTSCTTTFNITIRIESIQDVNAGTDQIKCPGETTSLNGNNPYCNVKGTWTRINCTNLNYYQVTIQDIHDPNTPLEIVAPNDTICPPDTLCFVWAFTSEAGNCDLTDTTRIIIRDSCCGVEPPSCEEGLHIVSACQNDSIYLRVLNAQNQLVDPAEYIVHWSPMNITGNPIAYPYSVPVPYTVEIYKIVENDTFCYTVLTGFAKCDPEGCGARVEAVCDSNGNIVLTLVDIATNTVIPPTTYEHEITWKVYGGGQNDNSGLSIPQQNPITIQEDACYSLVYKHWIYPQGVPHAPGYQTSICTFTVEKTCLDYVCDDDGEGDCSGFNNFMIAGCGDISDVALNLIFPNNCQSVCNPAGYAATLGLFQATAPHNPISSSLYTIHWENNTSGTYAYGNLFSINSVTITSNDGNNCVWQDSYEAECPCTTAPTNPHCEQPITKYCRPDGSFYYVVGQPQIVWSPVPGATGYIVQVTTGNFPGCCTMPNNIIQFPPTANTYWSIPPGLQCFSIKIKAVIPYCPQGTPWSVAYEYCPQQVVCNPVITVCGCCHGERSSENAAGLPVQVVPEETLLAYLSANPGTEYPTLQDALNAAGINLVAAPEFSVFPNPATDQIIIKAGSEVHGTFSAELTDLLQRQWRKMSFEAADQKILNVTDLPQGVYLITIKNAHGDRMLTQKVTVIR